MNKADFVIPPDPEPGYENAMTARIVSAHTRTSTMRKPRVATAERGSVFARRRPWLLAAGFSFLVASALVWRSVHEERSASVEAGSATAAIDIKLEDGSTVLSQDGARLEILTQSPTLVSVRLLRGVATFDVVPNQNRRFAVVTPDAEVSVLGTRFTVTVAEQKTHPVTAVEVDRGRVAVTDRQDNSIRELTAGQAWVRSSNADRAPPEAASAQAPDGSPASIAPAEPGNQTPPAPVENGSTGRVTPAKPSAAALLADANAARAEGNLVRAIARYEMLVDLYPKHPSASVAALELGRLRMRQGEPRAAAIALEQSLHADPRSPVREHSLANLVEAHERSGNLEGCRAARARYLAEFPKGARTSEVRRRCQ